MIEIVPIGGGHIHEKKGIELLFEKKKDEAEGREGSFVQTISERVRALSKGKRAVAMRREANDPAKWRRGAWSSAGGEGLGRRFPEREKRAQRKGEERRDTGDRAVKNGFAPMAGSLRLLSQPGEIKEKGLNREQEGKDRREPVKGMAEIEETLFWFSKRRLDWPSKGREARHARGQRGKRRANGRSLLGKGGT